MYILDLRMPFSKKLKELFSIDLRALVLFRIGLSIVIIFDSFDRLMHVNDFYTDTSIAPRFFAQEHLIRNKCDICFHFFSGSTEIMIVLILLQLLFSFLLLFGYRTRLATFLLLLFTESLNNRNTEITFGGDNIMTVLLFWSLFLPLGAKNNSSKKICNFATVAFLTQVAIIYIATALHKSSPVWWHEGTAIYYALNIDRYTTGFGLFLLQYPFLLKILTFFVIYLEFLGPFFLFSPFFTTQVRTIVVFLFFIMQAGIGLSLSLGFFPWISSIMLIPFLSSEFIDRFFNKSERLSDQTSIAHCKLLPITNIFISFCLIYVILNNLSNLTPKIKLPNEIKCIGNLLMLDQNWGLFTFSPKPPKKSGWHAVVGTLQSGKEVNLFNNSKVISRTYKTMRWRKFFETMCSKKIRMKYYSKYLCNKNNLKEVKIYSITKEMTPGFKPTNYKKSILYAYKCHN